MRLFIKDYIFLHLKYTSIRLNILPNDILNILAKRKTIYHRKMHKIFWFILHFLPHIISNIMPKRME